MKIESTLLRREKFAAAVLLALGWAAAPSVASGDGRVALVVGNSAYAAIGTLPNPGNDAADVSTALGRLGFDVTTMRDADRAGLNEALRTFTRQSVGADVALVFYAGHGLEMDGVNYLVVRHVTIFGHGHGLQRAIIDESQHRKPERLIMAQH